MAVGDAHGAPFEGRRGPIEAAVVARHLGERGPLSYSDDTALTIATAESLVARGELDEDHLAATAAATFEREPFRGYGAGTASLLTRLARGGSWRALAAEQFGGEGSLGNGAAMRATPIALAAGPNPGVAADLARRAARVTHTHPVGVEGAAVQAAAVALVLAGTGPAQLVAAVEPLTNEARLISALRAVEGLAADATAAEVASTTGTGVAADESVPAALAAYVLNASSFPDALRFAISLGGDTDTIASMCAALAGAGHGIGAIPAGWLVRTEGADRLAALADRLARGATRVD